MKTLFRIQLLIIISSFFFIGCQKEISNERGSSSASVGSLQADGVGGCLGSAVSGMYYKDTILNASNYVDVNVQVDTAGTYIITTDTVNGFYFKASGSFTATGVQSVRLMGTGKPLAAGTNIFTVTYNGTVCEFNVTVMLGAGASGVFTIDCNGASLSGTYQAGMVLTSANTVTLNVNVTAIGPWTVSTAPAVNGVTFGATGTFTMTGPQTIVLTGSGTPAAEGTFNYPVTGSTGSCNFSVTYTPAPATGDYFPRTTNSNWSYQFDGDPNDSLLVKVISQTLSAAGNTYNIFMYTDDASMGFDTSGYYRRSGADYFEWIDMGTYVGLDDPLWMEYKFLVDNQNAGYTWNSNQFTGNYTDNMNNTFPVTLRWEFSIMQKDVPITVNGVSYPNTIEVRQNLTQLVSGNWQQVVYFKAFFSRDKGLIQQQLYDNMNTLQYSLDVRRLQIF